VTVKEAFRAPKRALSVTTLQQQTIRDNLAFPSLRRSRKPSVLISTNCWHKFPPPDEIPTRKKFFANKKNVILPP
jgi:ABC-type iron transport system FetAB ATPase subunit